MITRGIWLGMMLLAVSVSAADEKASLLSAWEAVQAQHEQVASFVKQDDGLYQIEFTSLPFKGELRVLAYDTEPLSYGGEKSLFKQAGYIEYELVGAPDDMQEKYWRTFQNWNESNTLYYSESQQSWVTQREFAQQMSSQLPKDSGVSVWLLIYQYWSYALIAIVVYFFISQMINSRRMKRSLELQQQAVERSAELHAETNRLLTEILAATPKR